MNGEKADKTRKIDALTVHHVTSRVKEERYMVKRREKMRISQNKQIPIWPKTRENLPDENTDDYEVLFTLLEELLSALQSQNRSEINRIIWMLGEKP